MDEDISFHPLSEQFSVAVTPTHRFSTDSIILSRFATPRKNDLACDLCSGCGIVALSWFRGGSVIAPKKAVGVEIQKEASSLMELSIEKNNLVGTVSALNINLKQIGVTPQDSIPLQSFDVVTCNPPYQTQGSGFVAESMRGVARHELDCTIDDVCNASARLLKFGGRLCLCQRPNRLVDVLEAMRKVNIEPKRLQMIQKNSNTAPWLFVVEGKLGAKPSLVIEPPVIMYELDGSLSPQAKAIYSAQ